MQFIAHIQTIYFQHILAKMFQLYFNTMLPPWEFFLLKLLLKSSLELLTQIVLNSVKKYLTRKDLITVPYRVSSCSSHLLLFEITNLVNVMFVIMCCERPTPGFSRSLTSKNLQLQDLRFNAPINLGVSFHNN